MPTLFIKKSAYGPLNANQRKALRHVGESVSLGEDGAAPTIVDTQGVEWLVYADHRITPTDAARMARILADMNSFPTVSPAGKGRSEIHTDDVAHAAAKAVILPEHVPHTPGTDRWQEILDANDGEGNLRAAAGVPEDWTAA